ncbi:CDA_G0034360.mRNA.1.CDS.1 [Saccharomyces cerevisiae]|nr:CDA_G0034360.mRNA.1.CDS.1 [Saccharomyces cerevisiae]CAI7397223.1 CDA_G0034360.mRNA.1.CDS.1 [Saccharomyces cerevisiae]
MKENELKNEKSVDVLSVKQLESQKTVLPQDLFRSSFTWFCYEIYKSLVFRIWMLLMWLPLIIAWKIRGKRHYLVIVTALMFEVLYFLWTYSYIFRERTLGKQVSQFAKEIITNTPGIDTEDWERVAVNFNSYLYENKLWNTEYFFFDGSSCQEAFRKMLLEPFSLKKNDFANSKVPDGSVCHTEKALQVYFTQIERKWHWINSEGFLHNKTTQSVQFSKHGYGSKLLWAFKEVTIMNSRFAFFSIAYLNGLLTIPRLRNSLHILYVCAVLSSMIIEYLIGIDKFRFKSMNLIHKLQFLSYITCGHEKSDATNWSQIAKRTNTYMFEQKIWNSPILFSDGIDCEKFFKWYFSTLYLRKRLCQLVPLILNSGHI